MTSIRLPLTFEANCLARDLAQVRPEEWVRHYNTNDYEGEWTGVALRSVGGSPGNLYANPSPQAVFADTPMLARCAYLRAVLAHFQCPLRAVRLLRLAPGARIREHRDPGLGFQDGEVRIHVPVATNPEVEFVVAGQAVVMQVGEAWFIDFSQPHRVANRGAAHRVHLVLDCTVNDWLRGLLPAAAPTQPVPPRRAVVSEPSSFARLRSQVLDHPGLLDELRALADRTTFIERILQLGAERGHGFSRADVEEALRAGAPGLAGRADAMMRSTLDGWVPIRFYWEEAEPKVDWCYLGTRRFTEPLFAETIDSAMRLPFNLAFRRQTSVEVLLERQAQHPGLRPSGFIYHMSRCGSTLLAQMLAALPQNIVLSEAGPIDGVVGAHRRDSSVKDSQRCAWLRAMISALGQPRNGETHLFIKLDCWHTLDLPLIRQAFPEVPWIFLYRDPVEVLVSQVRERGSQTVPGMIDPAALGIDLATAYRMSAAEYCGSLVGASLPGGARSLRGRRPACPLPRSSRGRLGADRRLFRYAVRRGRGRGDAGKGAL